MWVEDWRWVVKVSRSVGAVGGVVEEAILEMLLKGADGVELRQVLKGSRCRWILNNMCCATPSSLVQVSHTELGLMSRQHPKWVVPQGGRDVELNREHAAGSSFIPCGDSTWVTLYKLLSCRLNLIYMQASAQLQSKQNTATDAAAIISHHEQLPAVFPRPPEPSSPPLPSPQPSHDSPDRPGTSHPHSPDHRL